MTEFIHFALRLDGPTPGAELSDDDVPKALEAEDLAWVHLSATNPESVPWLQRNLAYLPDPVHDALLAQATRPRVKFIGNGLLVILRGVNTNPGANPDDMVSIRLWVDPARIVSLSQRPLLSVQDLYTTIRSGKGPQEAGAFLADLIDRLTDRIGARGDMLEEIGEEIEDQILGGGDSTSLTSRLSETRHGLVLLRRFLPPQREAITLLASDKLHWIRDLARLQLSESHDALTRSIEGLDSLSERMDVVNDEIANAHSERLNANLYRLSILTAVFLPLGFLTGLMGVNLAGMPGANWEPSFWIFSAGLGVVFALQIYILWRMRWM